MARVVIFRRPGYVTLPMRWPVTSGSLALSQRRLPPGMQGPSIPTSTGPRTVSAAPGWALLAGASVDFNSASTTDYGQWRIDASPVPEEADMPYGQIADGTGAVTTSPLPGGKYSEIGFLCDNGWQDKPAAPLRSRSTPGAGAGTSTRRPSIRVTARPSSLSRSPPTPTASACGEPIPAMSRSPGRSPDGHGHGPQHGHR